MDTIALVIPCYNEEKRLKPNVFMNALSENSRLTLLFVDDGSSDDTLKVIQGICVSTPERAVWLSLKKNKGKAEAVRAGMLHLLERDSYEAIGFWDADLAVPISEVWDFMGIFKANKDVHSVIGSRVHLAGRVIERVNLRHYIGRLFATLIDMTFGLDVYDTQCGAKIFDSRLLRSVLEEPFCSKWIFDVELILRISRLPLIGGNENWLYEMPVKEWKNIAYTKRSFAAYATAFFDYINLTRRYLR